MNIAYDFNVQLLNFAYTWVLNKPYENEVTLTGKNPPLKSYKHLEISKTLRKGLDLLLLKILDLFVKGLQSYCCQSWSTREKVCRFSHFSQSVCKRIQPGFEPAQGHFLFKV